MVDASKPREWSPRMWEGLDYFAFLKLMVRNRFAVELPYAYIAGIMSVTNFVNTGFRFLQEARYGRQIDELASIPAPIFVLGHWRTGTTLLHELLMLDNRYNTPSTHQCLNPCHFLLSERLFKERLQFLAPQKRPMDNMPAGWDRPQEDEFALALLGCPSTYTDVMFPNRPPLYPGALDLSGLSKVELANWKRTLQRFLKALTVRDPRPLVLKSPPHTARIPELLALFPQAKFVHIRRDPYTLFASTTKLWQALNEGHGLQKPRNPAAVEAKVFREFRILMTRYLATKDRIPAGHLVEVRYEDFVRDLPAGMAAIYDGLNLGGYTAMRPKIEAYAAQTKDYAVNKFQLSDELRGRIRNEWGDLIDRLGYGS